MSFEGECMEDESIENLNHPATDEADTEEPITVNGDGTDEAEQANPADEEMAETKVPVNEVEEVVNEQELKYWKAVKDNPSDFTSWTYLLQFVEQENKLASARKAFDSFFKRYPYCYGYWKKYAEMERKNGNIDAAKEVFERGITAIAYSVDLWVHYLNFSSQTTKGQPDGPDIMHSLFERAVATAGQDYRSDKLWDAYLEWETSQGQLQKVTSLYDTLLTVPTQNYAQHFEKFKEHINNNPISSVLSTEELLKFKAEVAAAPPGVTPAEAEPQISIPGTSPTDDDDEAAPGTEKLVAPGEEEAGSIVLPENDAETIAIREKVIAARAELYTKLEEEIRRCWIFEDAIKRPYFHVKPLERIQLKNWRDYLDYEIANGDHHKVVILFERCVIACALYEDFWLRYASYIESHSIDECRSVYSRACTIHLPRKPNIHLAWAAFEEHNGDPSTASKILEDLDTAVTGLVTVQLRRVNLERRTGNLEKAAKLFEEALESSTEQDIKSFYTVRYSRFLAKIMNEAEKASTVLKQAIENDKDNKRLYLQLLDIRLNESPVVEDNVEEVFELAKSSTLDTDTKQGFSERRLEFLEDYSSNINKILTAIEAHGKLYKIKLPGTTVIAGKKRASDKIEDMKSKVAKTNDTTADSSTYQAAVSSEGYDASAYSAAYNTSVAAAAYSYANPVQNQWAAYNAAAAAAQPASYNYNQWYYGQANTAT